MGLADQIPFLRKEDEVGARRGGAPDQALRALEIRRLVGSARQLDARDAKLARHGERIAWSRVEASFHAVEQEGLEAGVARARAFHALRSRDFRLLWSGQTVSLVGNAAFFVAIGWRTQQLTGSSRSLALVLMLYSLAMLATLLVGGALADRYERRRLMIASDLSRLVVVAV